MIIRHNTVRARAIAAAPKMRARAPSAMTDALLAALAADYHENPAALPPHLRAFIETVVKDRAHAS